MIKFKEIKLLNQQGKMNLALLGNKYIITDLTSTIGNAIEHLMLGSVNFEEYEIYIWHNKELSKLDFSIENKLTRDYPPWEVTKMKLTKISDNLKTFELLYSNKIGDDK
jgi:hypothetical protein